MTVERATDWRRKQTGTVVFTNGVFDIIHPGHVAVLEQARAEGDCLIVAVNEDESARRLGKGKDRPVVPLGDRMRVVAAFESTDCVVSFGEDTPANIIALLDPDVLVKGADYEGLEVPGAHHVTSRGGRVVFVPLLDGHSSTNIVENIRATSR